VAESVVLDGTLLWRVIYPVFCWQLQQFCAHVQLV